MTTNTLPIIDVYHCPDGLGGGAAAYGAAGWYFDCTRDGLGDYGVGPYASETEAHRAAEFACAGVDIRAKYADWQRRCETAQVLS